MKPGRRIFAASDLELFEHSQAHADLVGFVDVLNESVVGLPLSKSQDDSGSTALVRMLDKVEQLAEEHPPEPMGLSRFGNHGFVAFYDALEAAAPELVSELLPVDDKEDVEEIATYLCHSFGDRQRIDYGSGHELNFIIVCYILFQKRILSSPREIVLVCFTRYIELMRSLQQRYWLEPAGSHGVWGLDDYQFLTFLFGSSQLRGHKYMRPRAIRDREIVQAYADEYIYLGCINFINLVKTTASLRWHSPMLDDISAVKSWDKVNSGLRKMFLAEVLGKMPIMQHFEFGTFIRATEGMSNPDSVEPSCCHDHANSWGDCCGIAIPSTFGAHESKHGLRPVIPSD